MLKPFTLPALTSLQTCSLFTFIDIIQVPFGKSNPYLADLSSLSTRKKNILSDLEVNIMGEVQDKGSNIWGLFSGITKYTTHQLKGDSNENKLFGVYGRREREVFAELGELVS